MPQLASGYKLCEFMKKTAKQYEYTPLGQIECHPDIPQKLIQTIASLAHEINGANLFTKEGINFFLELHPIHVITKRKKHLCIAGIRSYQLAHIHLELECSVPIIVHAGINNTNIVELSITDSFLTYFAFSLDKKVWDLDMMNIWSLAKEYCPELLSAELKSKVKLGKTLSVDRKRFSTKFLHPESLLQKKIESSRK